MRKAAFLRLKKLVGSSIITQAARHNKREIQAELGASKNIDATRSRLNERLAGPASAEAVNQLARRLLAEAGVTRLRRDAVMAVEAIFSLPRHSPVEEIRYFRDCLAWTTSRYGAERILSADVHRDEAAPHCHVLILPLIDGKMQGAALLGGRAKLLALQADFFAAVAARYGFRKPIPLRAADRAQVSARVVKHLQSTCDGALASTVWATIREVIEDDPVPFAEALSIPLPEPPRPKHWSATFTGTGKRTDEDRQRKKHIGFHSPASVSLSCVGFAPPVQTEVSDLPEGRGPAAKGNAWPNDACEALVRVREDAMDARWFDAELGDFVSPGSLKTAT